MRSMTPAGLRARWCQGASAVLRLEKTLSMTRRVEASARLRPRLAGVRVLSGREHVVPAAASCAA